MKKFAIASVVVATLVAVLMSASMVFAQGPAPAAPQDGTVGYGRGAWNSNGTVAPRGGRIGGPGSMGQYGGAVVGDGILHDAMIEVYAGELGLSVDELNARLEAGETLAQIAFAQGLSAEELNALMTDARSQAVEQAVADGTLTQAQADWSQSRGTRGAGMRGAGIGQFEGCPYYTQPAQ